MGVGFVQGKIPGFELGFDCFTEVLDEEMELALGDGGGRGAVVEGVGLGGEGVLEGQFLERGKLGVIEHWIK